MVSTMSIDYLHENWNLMSNKTIGKCANERERNTRNNHKEIVAKKLDLPSSMFDVAILSI